MKEQKPKKKPQKRKETHSEAFWEQMMGQNKQTLKRGKGGAYKGK
ncbi:hypothetical protein [Geomicrobium sp. JCM 19055]|nr:hypothetical protein [Geomicrobium sp. JCM 19055]